MIRERAASFLMVKDTLSDHVGLSAGFSNLQTDKGLKPRQAFS